MAALPPRYFEMVPAPGVPLHEHRPSYLRPAPPPSLHHHPELESGIRTLFVSGLPSDIKPREIHNLFRRLPAFEHCQLKYTGRGDQVVAFVTFYDHLSAWAALNEFDGSIFDPDTGVKLHVELARENSRTKRPRGSGVYTVVDKRVKTEDRQGASSDDGEAGSDSDVGGNGDKDSLNATKSVEVTKNKDDPQAAKHEQEKSSSIDLQPCSTLFIANLGSNFTEEKLQEFLSKCSGFQTLKLRARRGSLVAFADFKDSECSTEAMNNLQGMKLSPSEPDGIHVEYARSKMRNTGEMAATLNGET